MIEREVSEEITQLTRRLGGLLDELDERRAETRALRDELADAEAGQKIIDNFALVAKMCRLSKIEHMYLQGHMYNASQVLISEVTGQVEGTVRNAARSLRKKLDAETTTDLGRMCEELMRTVDERCYRLITRGLSKRWGIDHGLGDLAKAERRKLGVE